VFALLRPGPLARFALWLCALGGGWATVTGCVGIAVAFHDPDLTNPDGTAVSFAMRFSDKAVQGALYFGFAGMGLVLMLIAARIAIVRGAAGRATGDESADPAADNLS
jgi:hypothetical protein